MLTDPSVFEGHPAISPNGQFIAYSSDESSRYEVYVSPFPDVGGRRSQISQGGAREPAWARDGSRLYYRTQDEAVMVEVPIEWDPAFRPGTASELFEGDYEFPQAGRHYDVSPDGERFLMLKRAVQGNGGDEGIPQINMVLNWFEELKERVPVP